MDKTPGNLRYEQKEGLRLLSDQVSNILEQNAGEGEEIALKTNDEKSSRMAGTYYVFDATFKN